MMQKFTILLLVLLTHGVLAQSNVNIHDYPIPEESDAQLFYIQRVTNSNTVIYEANFDEKGILDVEKPVVIYWRMYEKKGKVEALKLIERELVFGLKIESLLDSTYDYRLQLKATNKKYIYLKQTEPYQCKAYVKMGTEDILLDHIFVKSDEGIYFALVEYIDVYGKTEALEVAHLARIYH